MLGRSQKNTRRLLALTAAGVAAVTAAALLPAGGSAQADDPATTAATTTASTEYVALFAGRSDQAAEAARRAIRDAGGHIISENAAIGTALVRTDRVAFPSLVRRGGAVLGSVPNRPIGWAPDLITSKDVVERLSPADRKAATKRFAAAGRTPTVAAAEIGDEPLAGRQWDMAMIGATATGSYAAERGDRRVSVAIIDTGVDGAHPDLAPNFDRNASRNFTIDLPDVDGPCEVETCKDDVDVDENGHGTHVAGTIGAAINGLGIAGVAPEVTLVNIRAGQDSGFFFLQPVVDALTYAADAGMDVVNMSFYVDPWLFNCAANAADSAVAQSEQQTTVEAVQRAIDYARSKGVTPIGALGNESTDLGFPATDTKSPNFPEGNTYERTIDNGCLTVPAETDGVISVAALGPSGRKAYYSNYGVEQADVSAPGGDAFDTADFTVDPTAQILSAYPEALGRANGDIDADGEPTSPFTVKDCIEQNCAYYQYLQGTSMAAPHAAGVAALAVSRFGTEGVNGFGLDPDLTEFLLVTSATRRDCPTPADYPYTVNGSSGTREFTHTCQAGPMSNGFYGRGVVSAAGVALLPSLTDLLAPPSNVQPEPSVPGTPAPEPADPIEADPPITEAPPVAEETPPPAPPGA